MVGPSSLLQAFSLKISPSSSSSSSSSCSSCSLSSNSTKMKNLIKTLLFTHVRRILRALSAAKSKTISIVVQTLKESQTMQLIYTTKKNKKKKMNKKIFFGSFRLHYNWCSSRYSHVLPVPAPVYDCLAPASSASAPTTGTEFYYDATWNSVIPTTTTGEYYGPHESQLSGYLQWLEEKKVNQDKNNDNKLGNNAVSEGDQTTTVDVNDIDKLADLFIASCHAKFILEKQESARRFKEMLERSA